jgi:hypothetical protein
MYFISTLCFRCPSGPTVSEDAGVEPRHWKLDALTTRLDLAHFVSAKIGYFCRTFIAHDKLPHLLFYGPPGTGKTRSVSVEKGLKQSTAMAFLGNLL